MPSTTKCKLLSNTQYSLTYEFHTQSMDVLFQTHLSSIQCTKFTNYCEYSFKTVEDLRLYNTEYTNRHGAWISNYINNHMWNLIT